MKMLCEVCKKGFEFKEYHHIQSKCYGGSNDKVNIAYVCSNCHTLIHRGKFIVEGRFDTSKGDILVWRKHTEPSITGFKDPKVYIQGK